MLVYSIIIIYHGWHKSVPKAVSVSHWKIIRGVCVLSYISLDVLAAAVHGVYGHCQLIF